LTLNGFELTAILFAFGLTTLAGLSTGIGGFMAFFTKHTNKKFLTAALGFAAGVMIYISFVELLANEAFDMAPSKLVAVAAFFGGILLAIIVDNLIPEFDNPHELHTVEEVEEFIEETKDESSPIHDAGELHRTGIFSALAIFLHNFPEGLITFLAALYDPLLGITIAIAIAIHNIPEGIAVSMPLYYASGSRKKGLLYSFLAGCAEPIGAFVGFWLLLPFLSGPEDPAFGIVFGAVAGIMVYVALDELLPAAEKYGEHHLSIYGLILGMFIMAVSLLMLG